MAGRGKNRRKQDASVRAEALKERAAQAGTLFVRLVVAVALSAGLYFGGIHLHQWATTSPKFALTDVTVTGHARATEAELLRMANLAFGQNLFRLDTAALERAMDAHPWVRTVSATRHFPSSVSVEVEEYEPAALVSLGELYLVDREGSPFKKLLAGDDLDVPLLTGISREDYMASPEKASEQMRAALELVDAFEEPLSEVHIAGEGMTVMTQEGVEIRMGHDETQQKLARLNKVRAELKRRGLQAEVIHLDNRVRPGWVTVKLPNPQSERRGSVQ